MKKYLRRLRGALAQLRGASLPYRSVLETLEPAERAIIDRVRPYTMTSAARILALQDAVTHAVRRGVPGAFAECGVWRGGSVMTMLLKLLELGVTDRDVYLYDTFEGMTRPSDKDTSAFDPPALGTWQQATDAGRRAWSGFFDEQVFGLEQVRQALVATGYPEARLHFVKGPVEQTIPGTLPERIALLRLDTDWYESTLHELEHMYPRLQSGGVLLIDDYGHWQGCRRAVDEYFARPGAQAPLLHRVDYSGRSGVKH